MSPHQPFKLEFERLVSRNDSRRSSATSDYCGLYPEDHAAASRTCCKQFVRPVPHYACSLIVRDDWRDMMTLKCQNRSRSAAAAAVDKQINSFILPQLRSLRRKYIGSVDPSLPVFPPQRVYDRDRRPWERISSATDCFSLCHNDLGPQNIFVCPDTFEIVGIIDWEFAGFFPPYFELPLWKVFDWRDEQELYGEANPRELSFFGLKAEDLKDCIPPP
ncbi:aminoglycoside phosphotransferase [Chaetomidium leptoderma]|uniref:Aminoglycoside phosphotransferase n=1 Tax=Chaetomidium leptoderma TaxID=669021 RepID=A0AAN6VBR3_9PEZI|nr:aminoglycoside phosphotransferase [Chaetomidium leptoderma]